jgi:cytochrome d ubiquinol oxidase subunit II
MADSSMSCCGFDQVDAFGFGPMQPRATRCGHDAPVGTEQPAGLRHGLRPLPFGFAIIIPAVYFPFWSCCWRPSEASPLNSRFGSGEQTFWDNAFCFGSIATFAQGLVLGAFIQGFRVSGRQSPGLVRFSVPIRTFDRRRAVFGYGLLEPAGDSKQGAVRPRRSRAAFALGFSRDRLRRWTPLTRKQ